MPEWVKAVEAARADLGIANGSRDAIEQRLSVVGMDETVSRLRSRYRAFVRQTGAHDRYVEYFAACVMSHFEDGDAHVAPVWLIARPNRWRAHEHPVPPGVVRIEFAHGEEVSPPPKLASVHEFVFLSVGESDDGPPIYGPAGDIINRSPFSLGEPIMFVVLPPGNRSTEGTPATPEGRSVPLRDLQAEMRSTGWKPAPFPYGIEVLWPYEVPMLMCDEADLREARVRLGNAGIVSTWLLVDRFVAFVEGSWVVLPMRTAQGLPQPTSIQALVGLPDTVPVDKFKMPVPVVADGSGAAHIYQHDTPAPPGKLRNPFAFRHLGEVRSLQPQVVPDGSVPSDERAFLAKWQTLRDEVALHRTFRPGPGAPPKRTRVPGLRDYSKLVARGYARRLQEWGDRRRREQADLGDSGKAIGDPTPQERQSMWEGALREVRHNVPRELRGRVESGTKAGVEAEAPWLNREV